MNNPNFQVNYTITINGKLIKKYMLTHAVNESEAKAKAGAIISERHAKYSPEITTVEPAKLIPLF